MHIKSVLKDFSLFEKVFSLTALVFAFSLLLLPIVSFVTSLPIDSMLQMKMIQGFSSISIFIFPALILLYLTSGNPIKTLKIDTQIGVNSGLAIIVTMVFLIPIINLVGHLNEQISFPSPLKEYEHMLRTSEDSVLLLTEKLLSVYSWEGLVVNLLIIAFLPAISEEIFFRGTLQNLFESKFNVHISIWSVAIIFSIFHFQFFSFFPRFLLGGLLGYLVLWSKSLWLPILAHFTNNAIAVVFYYLKANNLTALNIDDIGTGDTLWIALVSGISSVILLFVLWKHFNTKNKSHKE